MLAAVLALFLGHPHFEVRDAVESYLNAHPAAALPLCASLAVSGDPEVAFRSRRVLERFLMALDEGPYIDALPLDYPGQSLVVYTYQQKAWEAGAWNVSEYGDWERDRVAGKLFLEAENPPMWLRWELQRRTNYYREHRKWP